MAQHAETDNYAVALGKSYNNAGYLTRRLSDVTGALNWYANAIRVLEVVVARDEDNATARRLLCQSYFLRAEILNQEGRYEEALAEWDGGIAWKTDNTDELRMQRAWTQAMAKDYAGATREATVLAEKQGAKGMTLYNAACVFALASAAANRDETLPLEQRGKRAEPYARQAVQLLDQARQMGYFDDDANHSHLREDADLDLFRTREDFERLMRNLRETQN